MSTIREVLNDVALQLFCGDEATACNVMDQFFADGNWGELLKLLRPCEASKLKADVRGLVVGMWERCTTQRRVNEQGNEVVEFTEGNLELRHNQLGTRTELKLILNPAWQVRHSGVDEREVWITVEKLVVEGGRQ